MLREYLVISASRRCVYPAAFRARARRRPSSRRAESELTWLAMVSSMPCPGTWRMAAGETARGTYFAEQEAASRRARNSGAIRACTPLMAWA